MELTDKLEKEIEGMTLVSAAGAKGKTVKQVVSVRRGSQFLVLFTDNTYMTFTAYLKRSAAPSIETGNALWIY